MQPIPTGQLGRHAAGGVAAVLLLAAAAGAQQAPPGGVQLNLPENSEIRLLVQLVSQRLGVRILYDNKVAGKKISIKAPGAIPAESLLPVLESALKIQGLALIDADIPGWKQIVEIKDLRKIARPQINPPAAGLRQTEAITQAFPLAHVAPGRVAEIIKPFLTEPGGNTLLLNEQNVLVVTEYASNLDRIARLIEVVDVPGPAAKIEFLTARHVEAPLLQKQILAVLATRFGGAGAPAAGRLQITPDARTNQLVVAGPAEQVAEAKRIAEALDVPLGQKTEVYRFEYVDAVRIDRLVQDTFDELTIKRLYQSAIDEEDNLLIATTTPQIHERIRWLAEQLDVEAKRPGSAVQFYKLKFADAVEVLQTIQSIQQPGLSQDRFAGRGVSPLGRGRWNNNRYSQPTGFQGRFVPGPNAPAPIGGGPVTPPAFVPVDPAGGPAAGPAPEARAAGSLQAATEQAGDRRGAAELLSAATRVTADPTTNSIVVVGSRAVQEVGLAS